MERQRFLYRILDVRHKLLSNWGIGEFYPVRMVNEFIMDHLALRWWELAEPVQTRLVRGHVGRGSIVVDVGANIGYYTLISAELVGDSGHVFSFEPEPRNVARLSENVRRRGFRNVTVISKAVSEETGRTRLYLSDSHSADHRIYDSHDGRKSIEVDVTTLDDYFRDFHGSVDFVKIDVEGAEWHVLKGMRSLLEGGRNFSFIIEFMPYNLVNFGVTPSDFLSWIRSYGFEIEGIMEGKGIVEPVTSDWLLENYTMELKNHINLFCHRGTV